MTTPDGEFGDIQGLLWSGYGPLKEACFLLLRITDATAARAWLRELTPSVTTIARLREQRVSRASTGLPGASQTLWPISNTAIC